MRLTQKVYSESASGAFQNGLEEVKLAELRQCAIHNGMRIVGERRFRRLSAVLGRPHFHFHGQRRDLRTDTAVVPLCIAARRCRLCRFVIKRKLRGNTFRKPSLLRYVLPPQIPFPISVTHCLPRTPHPSASRPPSPQGKGLREGTRYRDFPAKKVPEVAAMRYAEHVA